ncbi:lytic transglycosylase domain-containing protein [Cohnella massiliensis]|uniref:lytic transglycosylase domain-containing protein n=1 Tax=Cohnella massiliensis TaxID=1816691 RepID=UPI001FE8BBAF|nr:lytic transglycosylase domain-containing protein [Cohnella massiliensis]
MIDMKISTDPRVIKELLLSQWLSGADPLGNDASSATSIRSNDDDQIFSQLLAQMLGLDSSAANGLYGDSLEWAGSSGSVGLLGFSGFNPSGSMSWGLGSLGLGSLADDLGRTGSYDAIIHEASARYGVDPALIKGVIQTESSFRADAVSSSGAKGLMQLMDATAQGLGVTDSFDPVQNIDAGTRYLSYLLRKYDGNEMAALAAYNAGPGRVDRLGLRTNEDVTARLRELPAETQAYVAKVLNARIGWTSPL